MSTLPETLEEALAPEWLNSVLPADNRQGGIVAIEEVQRVQDISYKPKVVRFRAFHEDGSVASYCLKAVFGDPASAHAASNAVLEARFFSLVAPHVPLHLPPVLAAPFDEERGIGFLLMRDMVEDGTRFMNVLEPWDLDWVYAILDQMALLHAADNAIGPIGKLGWVKRNLEWLTRRIEVEAIQKLLDGPRNPGLPGRTRDASLAIEGLLAFATLDQDRFPFLIHGDSHASNIFIDASGPGLTDWQMLKMGNWALDVAYHITSVLPVEQAEREERPLMRYYLDRARAHGARVPDEETAWLEYRQSLVYGHFLAAITRSMPQDIINETSKRLAHAVHRHDTFRLLGL